MGEHSKIEWTDHTFNPWRGCSKISEGCRNCYAEAMAGRNPGVLGVWGSQGSRVIASETMWNQPRKWNNQAKADGVRRRVFCASLADIFEEAYTTPPQSWMAVEEARDRLFDLIHQTPFLDWLLLTKRPQNVIPTICRRWLHWLNSASVPRVTDHTARMLDFWQQKKAPHNVWIGTSVENQETAEQRIPDLLAIPAAVRFLSMEPMLKPINLYPEWLRNIHWVIVGGESGKNARPMHPDWVRTIRDQCLAANVPFFFKQWGEWEPYDQRAQSSLWIDSKGASHESHALGFLTQTGQYSPLWHHDFAESGPSWRRVGKAAAGRALDGREWNQMPRIGATK